jgi:hypothetical protein
MSVQIRSLLLVAIVAAFGAKLAPSAQPPLTITISFSDGDVVKTGSGILVFVTLTNHSDKTASSSQDYAGYYTMDVKDARGISAPDSEDGRKARAHMDACRNSTKKDVCGGRKFGGIGLISQLKPGESWHEELLITKYYDMSRPGKYTIQLERKLPEELGKGTVRSNPITVTVTE